MARKKFTVRRVRSVPSGRGASRSSLRIKRAGWREGVAPARATFFFIFLSVCIWEIFFIFSCAARVPASSSFEFTSVCSLLGSGTYTILLFLRPFRRLVQKVRNICRKMLALPNRWHTGRHLPRSVKTHSQQSSRLIPSAFTILVAHTRLVSLLPPLLQVHTHYIPLKILK